MAMPISHISWSQREGLDPNRFDVSDDRVGDGRLGPFFGRALPPAGFPIGANAAQIFLLGNVTTGPAVGIQADGLLASAVEPLPTLIGLLDVADMLGITPAEVAEVQRGLTDGGRHRRCCWRRSTPRSRRRAVAE